MLKYSNSVVSLSQAGLLQHMGVVQKSFHFFPGLSQDLREAFANFRAWGFTTVGENGFSLGLEAFKDSCSCPGTSCVL